MKPGKPGVESLRPGAALAAIAAVLLLLPPPAPGQEARWYKVEVVVFGQGGDSAWARDNWREEGPSPIAENTVELLLGSDPGAGAGGSPRRHAFRTLPARALDLGAVVDRLERSGEYRVALHAGWHQPGFRHDDAPGVHLSTSGGAATGARIADAAGNGVDGTVRIWRRRFLHVDADVTFGDIEGWRRRIAGASPGTDTASDAAGAPEDAQAGTNPEPVDGGRLHVTRMTRSLRLQGGRIHYLDHPVFGVLLLVKRLD